MATYAIAVNTSWPPKNRDYDILSTLNYPHLAWEALRRNPDYIAATRVTGSTQSWRLAGAPNVLISRDRSVRQAAREFSLSSFRGARVVRA